MIIREFLLFCESCGETKFTWVSKDRYKCVNCDCEYDFDYLKENILIREHDEVCIEKIKTVYSEMESQEEKDIDRTVESLKKFNLYKSITKGLNEAIEHEHGEKILDENTHVYCTDCENFNINCEVNGCGDNCPCLDCDCFNPEDSRPFEERPHYEPRECD